MQVTITNATSETVAVSFLYMALEPGASVTISESYSGLDGQSDFKRQVEEGTLTLAFETEVGDSAAIGHPGTLESFADEPSLPDPADRPLFSTVWQVDADSAVWNDGTNWRTAAGVVAA